MHYENLVDLHTHSDHSFDGKQSCMLLCETAVAKGASCIAITDHCEIDSKTEDFRALCTNQYVETFECKRYFEGQLLVLQGIELGQAITISRWQIIFWISLIMILCLAPSIICRRWKTSFLWIIRIKTFMTC